MRRRHSVKKFLFRGVGQTFAIEGLDDEILKVSGPRGERVSEETAEAKGARVRLRAGGRQLACRVLKGRENQRRTHLPTLDISYFKG